LINYNVGELVIVIKNCHTLMESNILRLRGIIRWCRTRRIRHRRAVSRTHNHEYSNQTNLG